MPRTHGKGFQPFEIPRLVEIKNKKYSVLAYRYDGYGQMSYVYINSINGELEMVVWQDNHPNAQPLHFRLNPHYIAIANDNANC